MKFINTILVLLTISCIYIIGCVGLDIFPTIGTCEKADNYNIVLLNLSYSYIAGLIFYALVSELPYRIQKTKLKPIIDSKISDLSTQIECCVKTFREEETIQTITKQHLEELVQNKDIYDQSSIANAVGYNMNNLQFLVNTRKRCYEIISKEIVPYKKYIDCQKMANIEKIRSSIFFRLTSVYECHPNYNSEIYKSELVNSLYDVIELLRTLR